jgi:hypothetical protein
MTSEEVRAVREQTLVTEGILKHVLICYRAVTTGAWPRAHRDLAAFMFASIMLDGHGCAHGVVRWRASVGVGGNALVLGKWLWKGWVKVCRLCLFQWQV